MTPIKPSPASPIFMTVELSMVQKVHGNTPLGELRGHHVGRAYFFETQLWVRVQVTAQGSNGRRGGDDFINQFHSGQRGFSWVNSALLRRKPYHAGHA